MTRSDFAFRVLVVACCTFAFVFPVWHCQITTTRERVTCLEAGGDPLECRELSR